MLLNYVNFPLSIHNAQGTNREGSFLKENFQKNDISLLYSLIFHQVIRLLNLRPFLFLFYFEKIYRINSIQELCQLLEPFSFSDLRRMCQHKSTFVWLSRLYVYVMYLCTLCVSKYIIKTSFDFKYLVIHI